MSALLLDLLYATGLAATSPVWMYRMIRHGRYRQRIGERFGGVPVRYGLQPIIWIHGVSVGEINAARTLVDQLHEQLPDYRIVLTSTTDTGMDRARKLFAPTHTVFQWPMDFSWSVHRALERIRPDIVVLIEGDVWPNFLRACARRRIPVTVVNARMSADKGYPRYKRLGPLARRLFNSLSAIGVQDEIYARRYLDLGVDPEKVHLTGMMKFDTAEIGETVAGADLLAAAIGIDDKDQLIVAGGTGPGEERMVVDAFNQLRPEYPRARLAIVPRKPERFEEVARLIRHTGSNLIRRSERADGTSSSGPRDAIILGDTMGELRKFYALAYCVFVGRSLVPMGGSDMIEAAALGKPTCFGPHTSNFPQGEGLARHGCQRVDDARQLQEQLRDWLSRPAAARRAGRDARQYVRSQKGATRRNVEMICRLLGRVPAEAPGGIATDKIRHAVRESAHAR